MLMVSTTTGRDAMSTTRINGIKLDLGQLSDEALDALLSTVRARHTRAERDATVVGLEMGRRAMERSGQPTLFVVA